MVAGMGLRRARIRRGPSSNIRQGKSDARHDSGSDHPRVPGRARVVRPYPGRGKRGRARRRGRGRAPRDGRQPHRRKEGLRGGGPLDARPRRRGGPVTGRARAARGRGRARLRGGDGRLSDAAWRRRGACRPPHRHPGSASRRDRGAARARPGVLRGHRARGGGRRGRQHERGGRGGGGGGGGGRRPPRKATRTW